MDGNKCLKLNDDMHKINVICKQILDIFFSHRHSGIT